MPDIDKLISKLGSFWKGRRKKVEDKMDGRKSCPDCGTEVRWIEEYDSWYCDYCKEYKDDRLVSTSNLSRGKQNPQEYRFEKVCFLPYSPERDDPSLEKDAEEWIEKLSVGTGHALTWKGRLRTVLIQLLSVGTGHALTIYNEGMRFHSKNNDFILYPSEIDMIQGNYSTSFLKVNPIKINPKRNITRRKITKLPGLTVSTLDDVIFLVWSLKGFWGGTNKKNTKKILRALREWEKVWNSFTNLNIEVDSIELSQNEWVKERITVYNSGNLPAFDIAIQSNGDIEVRQESPIGKLESGEKKAEKVYMKGDKTRGNIPLELRLTYQNQYGVSNTLNQTVWTEVIQSKNQEKQKPKKETSPQPKSQTQKKEPRSYEEIKMKIEQFQNEEEMIDVRAIQEAMKKGNIAKADELLCDLEDKYQEYKETIERLEELDDRKSRLSEQLADKEIDRDAFNKAVEGIENKKHDLESRLNELREEVIHEDYEKPF